MGATEKETTEGNGIQDTTGQPARASTGTGSTNPQDGTIERTLEYDIGGRRLTGEEILNAIGRGAEASKFQAERDQSRSKLEEMEKRLVEAEDAERRLAEREQREQIEAILKQSMPASSTSEMGNGWPTDDTPPALDEKDIARLVQDQTQTIAKQSMEDLKASIGEMIREQFSQIDAERARKIETERFMQSSQNARIQEYMTKYGMSKEDAERVAKLEDAGTAAALSAQNAAGSDMEEMGRLWGTSREYQQKAIEALAEAKIEHDRVTKRAEARQALNVEDITVPKSETPVREINWTRQAREAKSKENLAKAIAVLDRADQLKQLS